MNKRWMVAAAACFVSAPVFAGPYGHNRNNSYNGGDMGYVDGYYVPSAHLRVDVPDDLGGGHESDDGSGWGAKGAVIVGHDVSITGEYQMDDYDHTDLDTDDFRAGVALGPGVGKVGGLYGRVEYVNFNVEHDHDSAQDGIGGHVGVAIPLSDAFRLYAEGGYIKLDDIDGPEFAAGGDFQFAPNIGAFADYRYTELKDNDNFKGKLSDFRLGVRFYF